RVPLLQQIRVIAGGKLEAIVEGHEGDLLPFAAAVTGAIQSEVAEQRAIAAGMRLRESLGDGAIGQRDVLAKVARAEGVEKGVQGVATECEESVEDSLFDEVDARAVLGGTAGELLEIGDERKEGVGVVADAGVVCDHDVGPLG